jgi:hypothetical protein
MLRFPVTAVQKFIVLGLCAFFGGAAQAQILTYTATGGRVTGTLNGTAFTNATWSVTATADAQTVFTLTPPSSNQTVFNALNGIWTTTNIIPVSTALMTLTDSANTFTFSLTASGGGAWGITSRDYWFLQPGHGMASFTYYDTLGNTPCIYVDGPVNYVGLNTSVSLTGVSGFDTYTYSTSAGNLVINAENQQAGAFLITTAVPESSTYATIAGVGAFGVAAYRRRRSPPAGGSGSAS